MPAPDIDRLYEGFCAKLPPELTEISRSLPFELKLAPAPGIRWSAVFKHRITLEAPSLLFEGSIDVEPRVLDGATLAHLLAVIEAFGTDRIADRQVGDHPDLRRVLALARVARDDALTEIGGLDAVRLAKDADRRTGAAIAMERMLLERGNGVDFETYEAVSAEKQAVGFPASMAFARRIGFAPLALDTVSSTLLGISLGLQFQDDVVDWEDDVAHGGAWAVVLARRAEPAATSTANFETLKECVHSSGVLAKMLGMSAGRFHSALAGAESLGAAELSLWLRRRTEETLDFCERERKSPGYLRRMKRLAPWAAEVL